MINILFFCLKNATVAHFQASHFEVFHVQVFRLIFDVCHQAEIGKAPSLKTQRRYESASLIQTMRPASLKKKLRFNLFGCNGLLETFS